MGMKIYLKGRIIKAVWFLVLKNSLTSGMGNYDENIFLSTHVGLYLDMDMKVKL